MSCVRQQGPGGAAEQVSKCMWLCETDADCVNATNFDRKTPVCNGLFSGLKICVTEEF